MVLVLWLESSSGSSGRTALPVLAEASRLRGGGRRGPEGRRRLRWRPRSLRLPRAPRCSRELLAGPSPPWRGLPSLPPRSRPHQPMAPLVETRAPSRSARRACARHGRREETARRRRRRLRAAERPRAARAEAGPGGARGAEPGQGAPGGCRCRGAWRGGGRRRRHGLDGAWADSLLPCVVQRRLRRRRLQEAPHEAAAAGAAGAGPGPPAAGAAPTAAAVAASGGPWACGAAAFADLFAAADDVLRRAADCQPQASDELRRMLKTVDWRPASVS
ncbi:unnamed protein product [Prorocentrum cordatum]|uniref:Uncharacterized protein n=1 Tax=Prorocentrum cordatum TaxID=2364126 RepID=A0ABN9VR98_9DINO|nr:unnamed protein product [Polarella glacialis]